MVTPVLADLEAEPSRRFDHVRCVPELALLRWAPGVCGPTMKIDRQCAIIP